MSSLRKNYSKLTGTESASFLRRGTTDGTLTGTHEANVNGSVTPVEFWTQPSPGQIFIISQIAFTISDAGSSNLDDYGGIVGPLTNGVQMWAEVNGNKFDFGTPFKSNRDFFELGSTEFFTDEFNAGVRLKNYTINATEFAERLGLSLNGITIDKFGIRVQDDLSTLQSHAFAVGGRVLISDIDL